MDGFKECGEMRIRHPATIMLVGASFSGKTSIILRMLDNINYVIDFVPNRVLYIYECWNPEFEKYKQMGVEFFKGWEHDDLKVPSLEANPNCLLIMDDSIETHSDPDFIRLLYTKYSHHFRLTCIGVCHNMYTKTLKGSAREIALNTMYTILTGSKRCYDQIDCLARQIFKHDARAMIEIYKKNVENGKHSYILIDCHPSTPSFAKIKGKIFEGEGPMEIYVPNGLEVRKHEEDSS